jgi:hypothetical protein
MSINLKQLMKILTKEMRYSKKINIYNYNNFKYHIQNYRDDDWKKYISDLPKNKNIHNKFLIPIENEYFDLFLINWPPNVETKIHAHSNFGCLQKMLIGSLLEKRFNIDTYKFLDEKILNKADVSYIRDKDALHQIKNIYDVNAFSLHFYHPKIRTI